MIRISSLAKLAPKDYITAMTSVIDNNSFLRILRWRHCNRLVIHHWSPAAAPTGKNQASKYKQQ